MFICVTMGFIACQAESERERVRTTLRCISCEKHRLCISKAYLHVFLLQPSMFTVLHLVN